MACAQRHLSGGFANAMLDVQRLLRDYNIDYSTEGEKVSAGWVGIHCPFCEGSHKYHLGYNLRGEYGDGWKCWRCGWHEEVEVIEALTGLSAERQHKALKPYRTVRPLTRKEKNKSPAATTLEVPGEALSQQHVAYLKKRGFDPLHLERLYGLHGTGHTGYYKFRVVAPIYTQDGRIIASYQARDITDRAKAKYLPCRKEQELIPHKHLLYARHLVREGVAIVVEGITDVWRLGPGAVATFGVEWTPQQVHALRGLRRCYILYDPEPQAQAQALKLARSTALLGVKTKVLTIDEGYPDPGDMTETDARELTRRLYNI